MRNAVADEDSTEERIATFIRNEEAAKERAAEGSSEERRQTTIYLDADTKRKLKAYCSLEEVEMSTFVNDLVADELEDWSPDL